MSLSGLISHEARVPRFVDLGIFLPCPAFFPSVSSVKSIVAPVDAVAALNSLGAPLFLTSAFDLATAQKDDARILITDIERARENGSVVIMDCGNYESYWLRDSTWTVARFRTVMRTVQVDLAFSFDAHHEGDAAAIADATIAALVADRDALPHVRLAPIVHVPPTKALWLPDIVATVAGATKPPLIAVAERELGAGVLERARAVQQIRRALDSHGLGVPLHLLGTGNPISLLIYALAGADTFDGLEWCQTVVDHKSALLFHHQQYDFFRHQTPFGDLATPYHFAILGHNILFFQRWLRGVREAMTSSGNGVDAFVELLDGTPVEEVLNGVHTALLDIQ